MAKNISIWTQDFKEFIESGAFYVDKTKQIDKLVNSTDKYYFLSRPRRFWKSLTLSMMKFLYLWKKELFKWLYIEDKWDWEKTSPVIYMSFAGYTQDQNIEEYIDDNFKVFIPSRGTKVDDDQFKLSDFWWKYNIAKILDLIYEKTWKKSAVIVDEYDKAVLVNITNIPEAEKMRAFFTSFYAGVKDNDDKIEIFMLTGLTKILKMSVFSVLNNLKDLSFSPMWYDLMWYTWEEVKNNFWEEIEILQNKFNFSEEETKTKIKDYYNWFNFWSENSEETIFNPWNINSLFQNFQFSYFWADTWIPSAILNYVSEESIDVLEIVEELKSWYLMVSETEFKLTDLNNINVVVLFANAGYFTIKKAENNIYTLWYPNKETESVMTEFFIKLLKSNYKISLVKRIADALYEWIINKNKELLEETFDKMIYWFMWETAYEWINRNPEGWLKTFIWMFLRMNNIYYYPEIQNLKWRSDLVIPVNNKYYIIEAKVNESAQKAIEQIDKLYIPQFTDWKEIIKVWINWDKENKDFEIKIIKN